MILYLILKTISMLFFTSNCIWSAVHLRKKVNSPACNAFYAFIGLQSIANGILLGVQGIIQIDEMVYIAPSKCLIAFFFEVPMLVAQVFVIKLYQNDDGAAWSEFSWDIALQFQFIFNLVLFGSIDISIYIYKKRFDHRENYETWIPEIFPASILVTGCLFVPVHLAQLGWVWRPELSDFGGGEISSGTIQHLLWFSMAIGTLGLWIWPIVFPILYLMYLVVFLKLYRHWYICLKAFLTSASAFIGFKSVCHLYLISNTYTYTFGTNSFSLISKNFENLIIIYASFIGSQVLVNLIFNTCFTIYEAKKQRNIYNKLFLILRFTIIIALDYPTLFIQTSLLKNIANFDITVARRNAMNHHDEYGVLNPDVKYNNTINMLPNGYAVRWSELSWDFSMQLQFMIQFVLFVSIDSCFYHYKVNGHSVKKWQYILILIGVILALCALYVPVYWQLVGNNIFKPRINDYGGIVGPDEYGIIGLMYISIGVGFTGCVVWICVFIFLGLLYRYKCFCGH